MGRNNNGKIFIIILITILYSCDKDNNNPGYTYFPDMTYSRAYESFSENPNFADGKTLREPVAGTIPRGFMPYPYLKEERQLAGLNLKNPFSVSEKQVLPEGKKMFERNCINCHGPLGDGKGNIYINGTFPFPPASLISEKMKAVPEGEIFHVITLGFGVMGSHASQIKTDDRWKIAVYIKNVLQK